MRRYRDHRPHDRFVSLSLALAACIGLIGVVGVRSINDKKEQQQREADWKAFQQSLLKEQKRLDDYRAQLVVLGNQLNTQCKQQQQSVVSNPKTTKPSTIKSVPESKPAPKPKPAPQAVTRSS